MAKLTLNTENVDAQEVLDLLDKVPLKKNELRAAVRPAAQEMYKEVSKMVGKGWGVRTGNLSREGVKFGVSTRDENGNTSAYRIYFSKKKGQRGKPGYIAPTFVARWLEQGTKPHFTAKGGSRRNVLRGKVALNGRQRKLRHPGFAGRPVVEETQKDNTQKVENITRNNILYIMRKKGVQS